ncbi:NADH-ubiquinone oxidoreductase 21 kDa subunit, mitochondrial [Leucoagaricus sp. SymC.cos]|nr:NADH-ubiquinone oxidoreductase 21 kDa subunit, mitochondrial [Leucoagaricus sp. SymC.cos]
MSLLRACVQASSTCKKAPLQCVSMLIRGMANDSATPATKKESSEIVAPEPAREVLVADVISGAPGELRHRAVRIYQPTRNTMQSGAGKSERWRLDFDILPGGSRWENPLMGWASSWCSADYMQGTRLSFRSKGDAIHFAEKQGWDYYVQPEAIKRIPPKNYSENFVYKPHKLRIMRTK